MFVIFPNSWPEILIEHKNAGISNYSIFQNGNQFFYYFECNDTKSAFIYLSESEVCQKWNAITSKMVEKSFDLTDDEPIDFMNQVSCLNDIQVHFTDILNY